MQGLGNPVPVWVRGVEAGPTGSSFRKRDKEPLYKKGFYQTYKPKKELRNIESELSFQVEKLHSEIMLANIEKKI